MTEFIQAHGLDIFTTLLGFIYIILEYRASIALWIVGIIMPAMDVVLYWGHGLYGDAGMAVYYTAAAIYGYCAWLWGRKRGKTQGKDMPITHFERRLIVPTTVCFFAAWAATYWVLISFTNSTIPVTDSFTNALSFVGLWALSRKYVEQWVVWIVVDVISAYLYITKGIPFKALLYGAYVLIAIFGYRKWLKMMHTQEAE